MLNTRKFHKFTIISIVPNWLDKINKYLVIESPVGDDKLIKEWERDDAEIM